MPLTYTSNGGDITIYDLQGDSLATIPIVIPPNNPNWQQFAVSFRTLTDQTALVFKIENLKGGGSGNDFMLDDIEVRLCTPPVGITCSPDTLVSRSVTLSPDFENNGTFNEPLDYAWLYSTDPDAPISTWQYVSYEQNLNYNNFTEENEGYYKLIVASQGKTAAPNCRAISDTTIHLVKKPVVHIDTTLADCAPIVFRDSILHHTGNYNIDLIDTIYHVSFTAYPTKQTTGNIWACDSILWHDKWIYESGVYRDTLPTIHGCDSTFEINFFIYPTQRTTETLTACDSAYWHGVYYYQSGTYIDTLLTENGCDSIVTLHLTIEDCTPVPPDPPEPPIIDPEQPTCDSTLIFQRWNDVLAIKNADYNGGSYFTDCQWFRNGEQIPSHPCSQTMIFIPEGLNPADCYEAELLTTEGDTIRTCCFYPYDGFAPATETPIVRPNPCRAGETIQLTESHFTLYDMNGKVILKGESDIFLAPKQAGLYILKINHTLTRLIVL